MNKRYNVERRLKIAPKIKRIMERHGDIPHKEVDLIVLFDEETAKEISKSKKELIEKLKAELERRIELDEDTDTIYFSKEVDFDKKKEVNNYEEFENFLDSLIKDRGKNDN